MRAKYKVMLFLLLAGMSAVAQTPQERLNKYISDGYACLAKKNIECAKSYCNLAEGMARSNALSNSDVLVLRQKIASDKLKLDLEKAFGTQSPLAPAMLEAKDEQQMSAAPRPEAKLKPAKSLSFPAGYPLLKRSSNQLMLDELAALVNDVSRKDLSQPLSTEEEFVRRFEDRLYGIDHRAQAEFLYDSTLRLISKGGNLPAELVYLHLRTVLYHVWDLMDERNWNKKADEQISTILQRTVNLISRRPVKSSLECYAVSGIENLMSKHFENQKNVSAGYRHMSSSVLYSMQAVRLAPANAHYLRNLFIHLNNLRYAPDSLLSVTDRERLISLKCELGRAMQKLPASQMRMWLACAYSCAADEASNLVGTARYDEAAGRLREEAAYFEEVRKKYGNNEHVAMQLALIFEKLNDIYRFYKKDSVELKKYTLLATENLLAYLGNRITSQRLLDGLEVLFDNTAVSMDICYNTEERLAFYKSLIRTIEQSENDFVKFKNIAYVYTISNNLLSEQLLARETAEDTASAQIYLLKAQSLFKEADFLKYYNGFSEDYAKYCSIFSKALKIYIQQQNYVQARNTYEDMQRIFGPVAKKYPFDFYFNQYLVNSAMNYGRFVYQRGKQKEAIAPLNVASFEGLKEATELLITIYSGGETKDTAKANAMQRRTAYQAYRMKKFTVPVICGNIKTPFDFFVMDRAIGYPYKGIADQAEWLYTAKGCKVPDEVLSSFEKLQKIAWDNNVSFQELSVYALGEANKEKAKQEESSETAKKENKDGPSALEISYTANKKNIPEFIKDKTKRQLFTILSFCLGDSLMEDAALVKSAILRADDSPGARDTIGLLYLAHTSDDHFEELFLSDKSRLKEFRDYFLLKDISEYGKGLTKMHYINLVNLDVAFLEEMPEDSVRLKKDISQHYNSLAWYTLLSGKFDNVMPLVRKSISYDKTNVYALSNAPHALLFTGEFEKAKGLYLDLKDLSFDPENNIKTFKDAFLSDFRDFEKEGILNDDCRKIMALLKEGD